MIIIDTSIWVEFFKNRQPFFNKATTLLEENQIYALECIFGELMQGALNIRERNIIFEYWLNRSSTSKNCTFCGIKVLRL